MTTKELQEIANIKKAALHEELMTTFPEVKTSQLPGLSQAFPIMKYTGLRTPLERLQSGDILISVGTRFEANSMMKILHQPVEIDGNLDFMHLLDNEKLVCGISENGRLGVILIQPTTRGPKPQDGAIRSLLPHCNNARHF